MLHTLVSRRSLPDTRKLWHMETLAWAIREFGAPHLPRVPSVLQRFEPLHTTLRDPEDGRLPGDWASDLLGRVQSDCRMENWILHFRQKSGDADVDYREVALMSRFHLAAPGRIHVNILGEPVVLADPSTYGVAGRTALDYIVQLATLRMASSEAPDAYRHELHAHAIMAMCVFNAAGLELIAMENQLIAYLVEAGWLKRSDASEFIAELEFATVLGMRVRGLAPEQIIASYGPILSKGLRKRVWSLCGEIDKLAPEFKTLKLLTNDHQGVQYGQAQLRAAI